jgi:ketosteroid isomerase-like protein
MKTFINDWITAANQFDTEKYLSFYLPGAILDDPSVGKKFKGHEGIRDYFVSYFIGYQTHTTLVKLQVADDTHVHVEVAFTGEFPEGKIGGTFDITLKEGKIAFIKADLIAQV